MQMQEMFGVTWRLTRKELREGVREVVARMISREAEAKTVTWAQR
jgi:hypothetical protein